MRIELFDTVTSTNDEIAKYVSARENVILSARRQTAGKGTRGRSFLSGEGGVYLSALLFFEDLRASDAFRVMAHAAVTVCRTAEAFGAHPQIKWANDVYACGRKLCGILIENTLAGDRIDHSIIGIGVNVTNDLSALGGIGIGLAEAAGRDLSADDVRAALIENFLRPSEFSDYLGYAAFLGGTVRVTEGNKTYEARAVRVLPDGRLEIEREGRSRALSAAEISVTI